MTEQPERAILEFIAKVTTAMGLTLTPAVEDTADGVRVNLEGEGAEALLAKRGEALKALQHLVDSAFRDHERRVLVDCLGYRQGKDEELKVMARFLADKAKSSGTDQEIGPLNPYERRLVHLAVAEDPAVESESIGDAFLKTVIISAKVVKKHS